MADVKPIPEGYPRVTPYLHVSGAADAIEFYKSVLGARERMRMPMGEGRIGHAELEFGDALVMLADEFPDLGFRGPRAVGGSPVTLALYVEDVDATFAKAVEAGAKPLQEPETQFYGDRSGRIEDPWGHIWSISTHV